MTLTVWARRRRTLHSGPLAGSKFDWDKVPALKGIAAAYHEPGIREIWVEKSAQLGFTQGFYLNVIGYHVEQDPCPILVLFAKDGAGKRFMREKIEPMVRACSTLAERIPLEGRSARSTQDYKWFPGGFLQLAGSNSPGNAKSTDFRIVIVEEPDDTSKNVAGQGDAITIARERKKSYGNGKMLVGGTPTLKGLSKIDAGMAKTDKRRMFVACPHCGHEQTLRWSQVTWRQDSPVHHPVYGTHLPDTARYACEACGIEGQEQGFWTDTQKNDAVLAASHRPDYGWRATSTATGNAGFYLSELYSLFAESRLALLVQKFLEADHALKQGDDTQMRSFVNNTLGECWELKGKNADLDDLATRGEDYAEWTCPAEALVATCFVDVQRGGEESGDARLEYLIVGWGRGLESWRIARGQVLGNPLEPATWRALDVELAKPIRNLGGGVLPLSMTGVDSGDGMTQEAVFAWVRAKQREGRRVIATKGSSQHGRPIFIKPKEQDNAASDRASKWGLKLYLIGTDTAKDTLYARLTLQDKQPDGTLATGRGEGRLHWPAVFGTQYLEQLLSEVKVPGRNGRAAYQVKAGVRNEMLDCEVGNLHAAYKLRLPQMTEGYWQSVETALRQQPLLSIPAGVNVPQGTVAPAQRPATPVPLDPTVQSGSWAV